MNEDDMRLAQALHRAADAFPVSPAPVDEVVRRGRVLSRRRRSLAGGAGAAALLAAMTLGALIGGGTGDGVAPAPPATAVPGPHPTGSPPQQGARTVRAYEQVPIGHGLRMALLPEGRQNYVVGRGDLTPSIELARAHAGGDSLNIGGISAGTTTVEQGVVYTGAFRTSTAPARVVVQVSNGTPHEAQLLVLRGDPGWGTYHAFLDGVPQDSTITVTALAPDGQVLARLRAETAR
ncbi:hypothetical protein [Streptomyces sp. MJP52]|uniref:hypothetical protein n=1 Tax=Streptomyces sp. MJP52 TaxID=2940555 RepID=UPI00247420C2|nr:hypothetical protein [Streptomyces sp. MJP52]MDH6229334.1 hypothetical protein [Streptomyces sp. MJP52]